MKVFQETQKITQGWLILIILLTFGVGAYSMLQEYQEIELNSQPDVLKFILSVFLSVVATCLMFIFHIRKKLTS